MNSCLGILQQYPPTTKSSLLNTSPSSTRFSPYAYECATDSDVPSATRFLDSLGCVGTSFLLPTVQWRSSAAADFLRANVLRSAPPAERSTSTIRSGW